MIPRSYSPPLVDTWSDENYMSARLADLLEHPRSFAGWYSTQSLIAQQLDADSRPLGEVSGMLPSSYRRSHSERLIMTYGGFTATLRSKVKIELRRRAVVALDQSMSATSYEFRLPAAIQAQTLMSLIESVDL